MLKNQKNFKRSQSEEKSEGSKNGLLVKDQNKVSEKRINKRFLTEGSKKRLLVKDQKRSLSEGSKTGVLLKDPKSTKKIFNQETFTRLQIFFLKSIKN